ncbi:receptor like protein 6, partial [Prunus dulcis]
CCSWDGVECDEITGHVIGLNLRSSYLYGSLEVNSSLFRLVHLQRLNLSDNNFNYSQIPSSIRNFPSLTHLDLSGSFFSGQVPSEVSHLSKLTYLRLCCNVLAIETSPSYDPPRLLKLQPSDFRSLSLIELRVASTGFFGTIPSSIEKLNSLQELDVYQCNFSNFLVPSALGNLRQLTYLDISANRFGGPIPNSLANLTQLTSKLVELNFADNHLNGSVPALFSNLTNLKVLYLDNNSLSGVVEFQMFQKLQNLKELGLASNNLEFVTERFPNIMDATVPQFRILYLHSCNLKEFPYFLRNQTKLERLEMRGNNIHGEVPNWLWNISKETLTLVDITDNFLSGELPVVIPWVNMLCLRLSNNSFRGPLPIPPPSLLEYGATNNKFTGEISPLLCNMNSLFT